MRKVKPERTGPVLHHEWVAGLGLNGDGWSSGSPTASRSSMALSPAVQGAASPPPCEMWTSPWNLHPHIPTAPPDSFSEYFIQRYMMFVLSCTCLYEQTFLHLFDTFDRNHHEKRDNVYKEMGASPGAGRPLLMGLSGINLATKTSQVGFLGKQTLSWKLAGCLLGSERHTWAKRSPQNLSCPQG